jgi:alanine racemase
MTRPVRACISASALAHNVAVARARMPGAKLMAAVKANAYGHGLAVCAPELARAGVEGFAVASMEEAEQLYDLALGPPACLLAGPFAPGEIPLAAARGHILVIHRAAQLAWLQEQRWDRPLSIWIKVDSGMHRLGFAPRALGPVFEALSAVHSPLRILGLMSHLARSDTPDDPHNVRQIREFRAAIGQWGERTLGEHSLANSGAILALAEARFPWMRPGLSYGFWQHETSRWVAWLKIDPLGPVNTDPESSVTVPVPLPSSVFSVTAGPFASLLPATSTSDPTVIFPPV